MDRQKVLAIVGPTGIGKTSLSVWLAKQLDGEIISCDSMQVYKKMDIGTAKVTQEEMQGIHHELIDVQNYNEPYNVKVFQEKCRTAIEDVVKRGKFPILCGGTGLYLKAALYDYEFQEENEDIAYTTFLNSKTNEELVAMLKEKDDSLTGDDVKEGLTMIISCKHPNPQFEGQTKGRLGNSEVRKLADSVFSKGFERFLMENPEEAKIIINKALLANRARNAARKAREITRKSDLGTSNFFGKLSDCKSKDPSVSEIFIVEGESAGGSAKKGRDSMTQAILPLKGKILNVEKARLDKALGNEEIRTIITAFGTGIGDEFDLSKLRYDKIIIMTDADVDGSHIRVLLLTLFYRFFRPIVEKGHVYAAQPPLFRIMHGKTRKYVLDEKEKDDYLASLPENVRNRAEIARMKGLGEMDAEELNETTMDIEKRVLRKITVDDCMAADSIFEKLMGDEVEPRRLFIEENAKFVENLDI